MFLFPFSIFLSALLLFQIQPMMGKLLLPWFGGSQAVWTTTMLFFQILLTSGYVYSYWLISRLRNINPYVIHLILAATAVALLCGLGFFWVTPITPPLDMRPGLQSSPVFEIFKLLAVSVALPYFLLAANGPLMQAWFIRIYPQKPYAPLYALSNFGSLIGLLAYPTLVEPFLSIKGQGWFWSLGFMIFGGVVSILAVRCVRLSGNDNPVVSSSSGQIPAAATTTKGLWLVLSGTAALLLYSVTNRMTQDIAAVPFLWVIPLTLYLLSFVLAFYNEHQYNRKLYLALFAIGLSFYLYGLAEQDNRPLLFQLSSYCLLLFSGCMLCHGELHRLRPHAENLTVFYLFISIGGALGGMFAGLIAPLIFSHYWEFVIAIALTLVVWLRVLQPKRAENHAEWFFFMVAVFLLFTVALCFLQNHAWVGVSLRNFYGAVRVKEMNPDGSTQLAFVMVHGSTVHGLQFIEPELRKLPTSYYTPSSGVGLALLNHPRAGKGVKVGILGVGVGTLAAYGRSGDKYRFYEINPHVIDLAQGRGSYFSFLKNSRAQVTIVPGDARISLEREADPQNFDILVLDTFSSDSIPTHLLTREAFALYLKHLAVDGIIAAHISSHHLDLNPVLWQIAKHYNLASIRITSPGDAYGAAPAHWWLLARHPAALDIDVLRVRADKTNGFNTKLKLWTDDYSNLFQILK